MGDHGGLGRSVRLLCLDAASTIIPCIIHFVAVRFLYLSFTGFSGRSHRAAPEVFVQRNASRFTQNVLLLGQLTDDAHKTARTSLVDPELGLREEQPFWVNKAKI